MPGGFFKIGTNSNTDAIGSATLGESEMDTMRYLDISDNTGGTGSTTALNIPSTDVGYEQDLIVSNITGSYVAIVKQEVDNAWVELASREITATGLYTLEFTPATTNVKLDIINTNTGSYTHALRLTGPAASKDRDVLPLARTYTLCDRPRDSYRFGFNGKEKDNEFAGIGNHLDFGDRMYDSRIGRWFKADAKQQKYPSLSPYHFGYNNPIVTIDPDGKENIVVAGGQHDNSVNNKLMFVHQAISKLREYAKAENEETRTLIIFSEGYTEKQLNAIKRQATKLGAAFITVGSSKELVNYINTKATFTQQTTSIVRDNDKISNVDAFSHGLVGSIEFGFELSNASSARFDSKTAAMLNPEAFKGNAVFTSYACRTGSGNSNIYQLKLPWESNKADKSLAQEISNSANITVRAYMTRTQYKGTLSSTTDRLMLRGMRPPGNAMVAPGVSLQEFKNRLESRENIDNATFDPNGAIHPVYGGSSPTGVDNTIQTFTPQ